MSEAKPNQEPTMEEILASIRRIISEDGDAAPKQPEAKEPAAPPKPAAAPVPPPPPAAAAPPPPPPPPPQPKAEEEDEVLELTEVVAEQAPPPQSQPQPQFLQPPPAASAPPPPAPSQQPTVADLMADDLALVSAPVAQQAASKFSDLASTVSQVRGLPIGAANRTLEDIVKELLRPMLKDWLDANLPTLVHRIVEREVAKLAGRVDESQGR